MYRIMANDRDREATAFHDAGHAVVADVLGFDVKKVSIVSDGPWAGETCYDSRDGALNARCVEDIALIKLCGLAAQRFRDPYADGAGSTRDIDHATTLCLALDDGGERNACHDRFRRLIVRADTTVAALWPAVERVAEALLDRGSLTGAEIAAIVRRVT